MNERESVIKEIVSLLEAEGSGDTYLAGEGTLEVFNESRPRNILFLCPIAPKKMKNKNINVYKHNKSFF